MIAVLKAFAWLRWRLAAGAFRPRGGRDIVSRVSRMGEVLGPWALAVMILPGALGLALAGGIGGWGLARVEDLREGTLLAARIVLGSLTAVVVLGPVIRSLSGSPAGFARFLLLPIPIRLLHAASVLGGLADPWLAVCLPGLLLFCAGLAVGGAAGAAAAAVAASVLLLAILLLLGSLLDLMLQVLFRDRRRGEMVTLVVTAALGLAGFLPILLGRAMEKSPATGESLGRVSGGVLRFLPSELWGATIRSAIGAAPAQAALALAGLLLTAAVLYVVSYAAYARLIGSPAVAAHGRKRARRRGSPAIPGLSGAASAVAWAQVRTIIRSVAGRSTFFVGPATFALLVLVFPRIFPDLGHWTEGGGAHTLVAFVGVAFSLVSLPRVAANQFALDGPGLTLQFLLPITDRDAVRGKAVGVGLLWAVSVVLYLVLTLPLVRRGSAWSVPAAVASGLAAYLLFAPLAAILAALLPKPGNLSKIGSGGKPHPVAGFAATFLALGLFTGPAFLAVGDLRNGATLFGFLLAAGCALLAAGVSWPLTHLASEVLARRREEIHLAARDR